MEAEYRDEDLDVVVLDVGNQEHKLRFKPFTISSGSLFIGDLRNLAAKQLNAKAWKVQLKFSGQELAQDHKTAKYYGIKRNSTVLCTLSEVSRNTSISMDCTHRRTTAGEALALELDSIIDPGGKSSASTQELRQSATDFPILDRLSADAPVLHKTCAPIVISHVGSSPQPSEHGIELFSNYTTSESDGTSTACTSIDGDLNHQAARNVAKSAMDVEAAEVIFTSMGDHLHDEDISFPSADMSETLEIRQDFSVAYSKPSPLNLTKYSIRLIDVGSFLGNDNMKLVAIPDYRAARYMIFDWYDESTAALWTTKKNLDQRMLGGMVSTLPEGLWTAIVTCRAFGIQYLWISTICTIADDEADIRRQSRLIDGIFNHAVGLFKTAGRVSHQYISAKIMQHQIRVIELPECKNTSSTRFSSTRFALERYQASCENPWTSFTHRAAIDFFWPELETYHALEQLVAVFQVGSGFFASQLPLLRERLSVANVDAQRNGGKLIGTSFPRYSDEVSKAQLLPVRNQRVSSSAVRRKRGQVSRHENSHAPQEVDSPAGGAGEQPAHLRVGQKNPTLAYTAHDDQVFDDLGNDRAVNVCTDTTSRKRKRSRGCTMKCPWCFADPGIDGPGCPRHICERQRHPNVKSFKGHHGKDKDHHEYNSEDMRVPSRPGASEREKMVFLIFKLVHGWKPNLQSLGTFLANNPQIPVPNPYITKANGECVACDLAEHSDSWRLPQRALVAMMTVVDERQDLHVDSRSARAISHMENPSPLPELNVISNPTQHSRVDYELQSPPTYAVPTVPGFSVNCMTVQPHMLHMNQYSFLSSPYGPETTNRGRLHEETAILHPEGPMLPILLPESPPLEQNFSKATSYAQRKQPATPSTEIVQHIGQYDQAHMSKLSHGTSSDSEGDQLAGEQPSYGFQSTQASWLWGTGHGGSSRDVRQEISEDPSETTASEASSAKEWNTNTDPKSTTVPSSYDEKAAQTGVFVPFKICVCNDCPVDFNYTETDCHRSLFCHRNPFCNCCNGFRAYSEQGKRFLKEAGEMKVCFCKDYLWPQQKHAQCYGKEYCNCCKKWRPYSEEGRRRLNQLMQRLAARPENLVPMEGWDTASEQLEQVQREQGKAAKGKNVVR